MSAFETLNDTVKPERVDQVLEDSFISVVHERILDEFEDSLDEAGFTEPDIQRFREHLNALPAERLSGILSQPYELRTRRLTRFSERLHKGEVTIPDIVDTLAREATERDFVLGFHMSNHDVLPRLAKNGEMAWIIDGKEPDHRDNDLPMAYYSTDLTHLYGRKKARFIYIIRAERGKDTSHRQDNDGAWGRAPKLDIVAKLDYLRTMDEARRRAKESRENGERQKAKAAAV